jgi:hypothetical protein
MQPFEEILARHLRNLGPFIGLIRPGTRIPELGAAKVARSDETWRQQIRDWVTDAALVVVAATPAEVSENLLWEIRYNSGAHFMTEVPGTGWMAWGARKRSEYTYAACLAAAFEAVRSQQPPPGATAQRSTPEGARHTLGRGAPAEGGVSPP